MDSDPSARNDEFDAAGPSGIVPPRPTRKRGRPRGNPKPLTEVQKKLRNAQYERERRNEAAEAMTHLQAAVGLEGRVSNNEIISRAIRYIAKRNRNPPEDLNKLRSQNQLLENEIAEFESIIAGGDHFDNVPEDDDDDDAEEDDNEDVDDDEEENQHEMESMKGHHQQHTEYPYNVDDDNHFYNNYSETQLWGLLGID